MPLPPVKTRLVQITASRVFIGQAILEVPDFCWNDRLRGIVAGGGETARFLAANMVFGKMQGSGLATPVISNSSASETTFTFAELGDHLRKDGFIF